MKKLLFLLATIITLLSCDMGQKLCTVYTPTKDGNSIKIEVQYQCANCDEPDIRYIEAQIHKWVFTHTACCTLNSLQLDTNVFKKDMAVWAEENNINLKIIGVYIYEWQI